MKLSFSTLGCMDWSLRRMVEAAKEYGYQGIELRGLKGMVFTDSNLSAPKRLLAEDVSAEERKEIREVFRGKSIELVCLSTNVTLGSPDQGKRNSNLKMLKDHIELARDIGPEFIRVFGDLPAQEAIREKESMKKVAGDLSEAGDWVKRDDFSIVIETHGRLAIGEKIAQIIKMASNEKVGILWDIGNTAHSEPIEETFLKIKPYIYYTHVKDWKREDVNTLLGEGEVDTGKAVSSLKNSGYQGYLGVEWERYYDPSMPEPEVALPQHAQKLKEYIETG